MHLLARRLCRLSSRESRQGLIVRERLDSGLGRVDGEGHSGLTVRGCTGCGAGLTTVAPDGGGGVDGDFEGGAAGGGEVGTVDGGAVGGQVECQCFVWRWS